MYLARKLIICDPDEVAEGLWADMETVDIIKSDDDISHGTVERVFAYAVDKFGVIEPNAKAIIAAKKVNTTNNARIPHLEVTIRYGADLFKNAGSWGLPALREYTCEFSKDRLSKIISFALEKVEKEWAETQPNSKIEHI